MKLLYITHYDNLYGANNALLKLVKSMKDKGNEVLVIVCCEGKMAKRLSEMGVRYIVSEITQWQAVYLSPVRFWVKSLIRKPRIKREVQSLYEKLKDEHIDIIHSNSSVIGHGAMLSLLLSCKHVWHIREFSKEHFNMHYFYSQNYVKKLYTKANALIAISDALAVNYRNKYENANVIRIYDGVNEETVSKENNADNFKRNYENQVVRFVYVGYLFKKKHQLEVIKACKRLFNEGFTAFEMHFIGDGKDDYKDKLKKEIKESGLSNIYLDGYVEDVFEHLKAMDVGIIASEYEGFGLVTVEYMLSKMPVIGHAGGGTSEIVKDAETGILYESQDELVFAMKKLMEDCELRKRLGTAGYTRASKVFNEENNVDAVLKLYDSLI